jgi:hypothetical protein
VAQFHCRATHVVLPLGRPSRGRGHYVLGPTHQGRTSFERPFPHCVLGSAGHLHPPPNKLACTPMESDTTSLLPFASSHAYSNLVAAFYWSFFISPTQPKKYNSRGRGTYFSTLKQLGTSNIQIPAPLSTQARSSLIVSELLLHQMLPHGQQQSKAGPPWPSSKKPKWVPAPLLAVKHMLAMPISDLHCLRLQLRQVAHAAWSKCSTGPATRHNVWRSPQACCFFMVGSRFWR